MVVDEDDDVDDIDSELDGTLEKELIDVFGDADVFGKEEVVVSMSTLGAG